MKVGIYARVSTDDKGQDLEIQLERCKKYCDALEWEYVVFQDHDSGYSKPSEERQGFSQMMEEIRTRALDGVLVYSMDRFSREDPFKVHRNIGYIVKTHKAVFVSITDGVDSRTDVFPVVLSIMSWMANNWSKAHSARVKAGIAKYRAQGLAWGRSPLGVKKRNQVLRMYAREDRGVREIARELDISPATVSKTLAKAREGKIPVPKGVTIDLLKKRNGQADRNDPTV